MRNDEGERTESFQLQTLLRQPRVLHASFAIECADPTSEESAMRGPVVGLPHRTMINHAARPSVKTIKAIYMFDTYIKASEAIILPYSYTTIVFS